MHACGSIGGGGTLNGMRKLYAPIGLLVAVLLVVPVSSPASASSGEIRMCVNKQTRETRVLKPNKKRCRKNERLVIVNAAGVPGKPGQDGKSGSVGDKGEKGDAGATGAQGPSGATGPAGATGAQGPAGAKGDKGDTGDTGPAGAKGDKGDKGDTGDTGPAGAKGDAGTDAAPETVAFEDQASIPSTTTFTNVLSLNIAEAGIYRVTFALTVNPVMPTVGSASYAAVCKVTAASGTNADFTYTSEAVQNANWTSGDEVATDKPLASVHVYSLPAGNVTLSCRRSAGNVSGNLTDIYLSAHPLD